MTRPCLSLSRTVRSSTHPVCSGLTLRQVAACMTLVRPILARPSLRRQSTCRRRRRRSCRRSGQRSLSHPLKHGRNAVALSNTPHPSRLRSQTWPNSRLNRLRNPLIVSKRAFVLMPNSRLSICQPGPTNTSAGPSVSCPIG